MSSGEDCCEWYDYSSITRVRGGLEKPSLIKEGDVVEMALGIEVMQTNDKIMSWPIYQIILIDLKQYKNNLSYIPT